MIVIDEIGIASLEDIEFIVEKLKENAYKDDYKVVAEMYHEFLLKCFDADIRLQEMVLERLGEDFISFVILPVEDVDDLTAFSFQLANKEDKKITRRDEIIYKDFCDVCFGGIKPFYLQLLEFYDEP